MSDSGSKQSCARQSTLLPASDHSTRPHLFHVKQPLFLTARLLKTHPRNMQSLDKRGLSEMLFLFLFSSFLSFPPTHSPPPLS